MTSDDPFDWRRYLDTPRLIVDMPNTVSFLIKRQLFRGRSIVWLKQHYDGLSDMPKDLRDASSDEMLRVATAIQRVFKPARMNYACFGNVVPHVHWHLVPRYKDDPDWNGPPDFSRDAPLLADSEYAAMATSIRDAIEAGS